MNNLRNFPGVEPRVETGPIQFGDDWPGVFFRGDNALSFANMLEQAIKSLPEGATSHIAIQVMKGLVSDLRSCSVGDTGWPP